ncbi:MAG: hypothetical protein ACK4OI_18445, partial [Rhizobium oryzihabitans]
NVGSRGFGRGCRVHQETPVSLLIDYDYYYEARFGKLNLWETNFCSRKFHFRRFLSYLIDNYK